MYPYIIPKPKYTSNMRAHECASLPACVHKLCKWWHICLALEFRFCRLSYLSGRIHSVAKTMNEINAFARTWEVWRRISTHTHSPEPNAFIYFTLQSIDNNFFYISHWFDEFASEFALCRNSMWTTSLHRNPSFFPPSKCGSWKIARLECTHSIVGQIIELSQSGKKTNKK